MSGSETTWNQAREISQTVELIQSRMMAVLSDDSMMPALTPRQFALVIRVRNKGGISIKDLADELGVTASSASTMVDRLVEGGILTREQNPADRREVIVRVSADFEQQIEPVERCVLRFLVDLLEKVGPECAKMWTSVYGRIRRILEDEQHQRSGRDRGISTTGSHES